MKILVPLILIFTYSISAQNYKTIGTIDRLDPAINKIIPQDSQIELLADGFIWSEGPVWKDGSLLFNDIPSNTLYKWDDKNGLNIYLRPAGFAIGDNPSGDESGSNGLYIHPKSGKLILCDHGNRCLAELNEQNWSKKIIVDKFDGKRFNSPNDVVIRSDGHLYFTDPPYGLQGGDDNPAKELDFSGVFHLSPDGQLDIITKELPRPNGIILSPDEKTLYVANSSSNAIWMAYDVAADGSVSNGRLFYDGNHLVAEGKQGGCDGMTVDTNGNIYATGPGGVLVISPAGKLLGVIETGERIANCCFGGENGNVLYMTSHMYLCRIVLTAQGTGF
jgi:gluconolactonase